MAEAGLFIGWGSPRTGRERAAAEFAQESLAYWEGLKAKGEIESLEVVLLAPHGGDLNGFAMLRGDAAKLAQIRMTPEYMRFIMRAGTLLENLGVVPAIVDAGVQRAFDLLQEATADLV